MSDPAKIETGSINIHRKVIAEIVVSAIKDIDGIRLAPPSLITTLADWLGMSRIPGVVISTDKNNQVTIEVQIIVKFGRNIPDVARIAQDAVRRSIEQTVDIELKDVNVNIQGIDRSG